MAHLTDSKGCEICKGLHGKRQLEPTLEEDPIGAVLFSNEAKLVTAIGSLEAVRDVLTRMGERLNEALYTLNQSLTLTGRTDVISKDMSEREQ